MGLLFRRRCCRYRYFLRAGLLTVFTIGIGCFVLAAIFPVLAQSTGPTELFFSEYIEGSSNNKALEIFNGTGSPIDLTAGNYVVQFFSNGNNTASASIPLTGIIADGDVFVLADDGAAAAILAVTDQIATNSFFNGDDAVALVRDGAIIDVIGQIGFDPGSQWGSGAASTQNNTLRRQSTIEAGDPDGSNAFDPSTEWDGFPNDTFDGLGAHTIASPPDTATPTPTATPTEPAATSTSTSTPTETPSPTSPPPDTATPTETVSPSPSPSGTVPPTNTPTATPSPIPTETAIPTSLPTPTVSPTSIPAPAGVVVINEVVTDPQQDWGGNNFNGTPGVGAATSGTDEFVELLIKTGGLNLTGWTIELLDTTPVSGDLTGSGAFQVSNYFGAGSFAGTVAGDYLVLGNVAGSGAMNNNILIILRDDGGSIIDKAEIGSDPEGDGDADGAPDGNATDLFDEAVFRYPNGADTDVDALDFIAGSVTLGQSNNAGATPTPLPIATAINTATPTATSSPTATGTIITPTLTATPVVLPTETPAPAPALPILISEFLYDGETPSTEGDEFVELCNSNADHVSLAGYKVGDEESGGGESMYHLPPSVVLDHNECVVIAKNALDYQARFGALPDFEVSELSKYTTWGSGSWSLSNSGDELVVLGPNDEIVDSVAYRNGNYNLLGLEGGATAPQPHSLQRVWPTDTNSMPHDFVRTDPNPGQLTEPPSPPGAPPQPASLPGGMNAYWGHLHAHTTYSDGSGPPHYALAKARAAGMHFYGLTDHAWWMTESEWRKTLTQTEAATVPGQFVALRGLEWSHATAGHINIFNNNTLVQRTHPLFSTLSDMYTWLANNPNVVAQFNHPDPGYGGTFDDFALHPSAAQVVTLQEIGNNAHQYTTYEPSFVQSNAVGWKTAPTINGDVHDARWGTDMAARTGIVAPGLTENDLLAAMRARRVFATEDSNLALSLRAGDEWMGSVISSTGAVSLTVNVVDADAEPVTLHLYDRNLLINSVELNGDAAGWATTVAALPGHYFWIKAVQADGDAAYTAPIWIAGQALPDTLYISELLPSPGDKDWDGDGTADYHDEWIELFNPLDYAVGLGGWRLVDSSGTTYLIPLRVDIPAGGFVTLYNSQTNIGLNNDGDSLSLIHPNGTVVDTFSYNFNPGYDETWCRLFESGGEWNDDCAPSPGSANWKIPPAAPLEVSIYNSKRLSYNAWVKVRGWVTAPPGVLGSRTMYIQDDTGGILVYLPKDHRLSFHLGDEVKVEGNLRTFHYEFEIVVDERGDVDFVRGGVAPPPLPIATTSLLEPYEGMLVQLQGQAVQFKGRSTFWLDDGTDPAKIYIRRSTGIKKPFIDPGSSITVVGVVSQYSDEDNPVRADYRLLPRFQTDLNLPEVIEPAGIPPDWPTLLPETGYK